MMLFKRLFYACIFLGCTGKLFAQVNLQTGSATFSLPMFNWKDSKSRLYAGVALSYNSGNGLKVNDVASNAGQGWSVVAGGVITRLQVGEPDDQKAYGQPSETDITKYPDGFLYATVPAGNGCPEALTKYPIYGSMNQLYSQHNIIAEDKQTDYFSFQFNGKAGLFVLDLVNGNGIGEPLGDTKMKITFQRDTTMTSLGKRTTIASFQVYDVDGLVYKFTQQGLTKVLKDEYCDRNNGRIQTQPKFDNNTSYVQAAFDLGPAASPWKNAYMAYPWVINSWYLTEIEDALTHRKINITYTVNTVNNPAGTDIVCYEPKDYTVITMKRSLTLTPNISNILFPDGHSVAFNYGSNRIDLNGDKVLSSVDIKYSDRYLSRYRLNTTYFIRNRYGTPMSDYQKQAARLCLRSVTKLGVDLKEDTPPYIFDYYMGSNATDDYVPLPFSYAKDIWGFYNGDNTKDYNNNAMPLDMDPRQLSHKQAQGLCFLRTGSSNAIVNPKSGYAKNGLLRQIIYPTGGTLTYEYGQNYGKLTIGGTEQMVGGVHVSKTLSTDGGYSNGCATPVATQYDYVVNGTGSASSLWGLEMPLTKIDSKNQYAPELRKYKYVFPAGKCYYVYEYPGILSMNQAISLTDFQRVMEAIAPVLGIVSMVSTIVDVVSLFCASTGWLAWVSVIVEIVGGLITLGVTCLSNRSSNDDATTYFNTDLNSAAPLPAQFKRVEVTESPGNIGKTVHEFTSSDDYPLWYSTNPSLASKQRFAPWAYGLPKITTIYDASGNTVKQTRNIYNFNYARTECLCGGIDNTFNSDINSIGKEKGDNNMEVAAGSSCKVSTKCFVKRSHSQRNVDWANPSFYNASYITQPGNTDILVDTYNSYTGRTLLDSVNERIYKQGSNTQYLETTTRYYYNANFNYDINTIATIQSNGDKTVKTIKYSSDYCCQAIAAMLTANMVSIPVETKTLVTKADASTGYLNETVTEFTQLANGDVRPSRILEQRFAQPASSLTEYTGPGGSTTNYKVIQQFQYDVSYNLIGLTDEGGRTLSNIYDYDDKYVVASVINADPVVDKSAYTSFETGSFGKWNLSGSTVYVSPGITGSRAFTLSAGKSFTTPLNSSKAYTLSFWASTSTIAVSAGATLVKSGPTYNNFTYYEYDIAAGTASVTVSGTGNIDELRAYPKAARMRTITYDPLLGKTSECDENNRITYYEYDNLGRLMFVRDENRDIVKTYEYNNISPAKQNGCPAAYYSRMVSEKFTRNSCSANYIGSEVVFTIPANKYASTISQEDADLQAELDLLTNGQAYANGNGTCAPVYYNTVQTGSFTSQTCDAGYKGNNVTYTVPANTYSSLVSVADANAKAQVEIAANGQVNANKNPSCSIDTDPDWEADADQANAYCLTVNGQLPAHRFLLFKDMNPNSVTYNQTQWYDIGPQSECPSNAYFNAQRSQAFTRNNCGTGFIGSSVTYTVPPGKYSSTSSQAAADQLAINDINANGQNYANAYGTCTLAAPCSFTDKVHWTFTYFSLTASASYWTLDLKTMQDGHSFNFSSPVQVGTIGSGCRPAADKTVTCYDGSRVWIVSIKTSGYVYIQLSSGTTPDEGEIINIYAYYPQ